MAATTRGVTTERSGPELIGPWADALFGYGILYLASIPLVLLLARKGGLASWPSEFVILAALLIAGPHYAATILRVYEKSLDRRKYAFFAVWVTILLAVAFIVGLFDASVGSWILTAYVYWSPWHFAGQNFGVAVMSLRRRSVPIDRLTRRLLHASFFLAFALSFISMQTQGTRGEVALGASGANAYHIVRFELPPEVGSIMLWVVGIAYLGATIGALARLGRNRGLRSLGPTLSLIVTHSLWYVFPILTANEIPLIYSAVWISVIHSLQYLWVTTYYASRTDKKPARTFYWQCALVGGTIEVASQLVFAPGLLGRFVPFASDADIVVFSILNLHHFVLDGAIWKLRDSRVGRILLVLDGPDEGDATAEPESGFMRPIIYGIGAVALALPVYFFVEVQAAVRSDSLAIVEGTARRLHFWGVESATVEAAVGSVRNRSGDHQGALAAYRRAYDLAPNNPEVAARLAALLLDEPNAGPEALKFAKLASSAENDSNPILLIILARASAMGGDVELAREALRRAEKIASVMGRPDLVEISRGQLEMLQASPPAPATSEVPFRGVAPTGP